jgi:hypothetical protein
LQEQLAIVAGAQRAAGQFACLIGESWPERYRSERGSAERVITPI